MAKLQKFYFDPHAVMQDNFPTWMFFSRSAQILLTIIVLALDAFILNHSRRMNSSATRYNAFVGLFVGDSHFYGFTMFTAVVSLLIFTYVLVAPKRAPQFYHVYGELALEAILVIFWLTAFAGMANYMSKFDGFAGVLDGYMEDWEEDDRMGRDLIKAEKSAQDCGKAVSALGALVFLLCLANAVFLAIYCLRKFRADRAGGTTTEPTDSAIPKTAPMSTTPSAMPPGFAAPGNNGETV